MWRHLREMMGPARNKKMGGSIHIRIEHHLIGGGTVAKRPVAFSTDARELPAEVGRGDVTASLRAELHRKASGDDAVALGIVLALSADDVPKLPADQFLRPQVITDIGGGHREAWWFLAEPAASVEANQVAAAMRRRFGLKGGARGLLPGTVVQSDGQLVTVTVVEASGYTDDFMLGSRVDLDDLRIAFTGAAGPLATVDDLLAGRPLDWLVSGLLMERAVTVMVAAPSSFKSAMAVEIACSVATGRAFNGGPVRPARVVYAALERKEETAKRVRAWAKERQPVPTERLRLWREPLVLNDEASVGRFVALVREWAGDEMVELVVIDTLAKGILGDDVTDMPAAVRGLRRINEDIGCALLVIHHTPQGEGRKGIGLMRGRSDLAGDADQALSLHRTPGSDRVIIRSAKDPAGAAPPHSFVMQARVIELPELGTMLDGRPSSALLLEPVVGGGEPDAKGQAPSPGKGQIAREAILTRLADAPATPSEMAAMLPAELPDIFGAATPASLKQTVRRALADLKRAGAVIGDDEGRWRAVRT